MARALGGFWTAERNRKSGAASPEKPPLATLLGNAALPFDLRRAQREHRAIAAEFRGDGRPVLLLPGFLASDLRMAMLRATLNHAGYRAYGWGMGRNFGATADLHQRIDRRVRAIEAEAGGPVTLIGWSLGGLFAREYAKFAPRKVRAVMTLGTPFSGDPRANHAWKLYQFVAGHSVDSPPVPVVRHEKPPVPTMALWSRRDGVIMPDCAAGCPGERDAAMEVDCTHMGFAASPEGIRAVCTALQTL